MGCLSTKNPEGRPTNRVFRFGRRSMEKEAAPAARLDAGDHRRLGRELGLFTLDIEVGKGLPLWLPHGTVVREELEKLAKELEFKAGFERVATPHLARTELYRRSGHLPYYERDMYPLLA